MTLHVVKTLRSSLKGLSWRDVKLFLFVLAWWVATVLFNISNKIVLDELALPCSVAVAQLLVGILCVLPVWGIQGGAGPGVTVRRAARYAPLALMHGLGHLSTVISVGSGSVAFTHVVKAAEPLFAAALSLYLLGTRVSHRTACTLLVIVVGVGWSAFADSAFGWLTFGTAMCSNLCNQLRIVLAKAVLTGSGGGGGRGGDDAAVTVVPEKDKDVAAGDVEGMQMHQPPAPLKPLKPMKGPVLFRLVATMAALQLLPIAVIVEAGSLPTELAAVASSGKTSTLLLHLLLSGGLLYAYNELGFRVLDLVRALHYLLLLSFPCIASDV